MVAVVTGAADGIGRECALRLKKKGYRVYDISRRKGRAEGVRRAVADVADREGIEKALDAILNREGRIDVLVTSAGVSLASPAELTSEKDMRRLFDVNLWGSVHAANHVLKAMKRQKSGTIVLVSSLSALYPMPYLAYYSASKAAVAAYARALAGEARPFGVKVFAALPPGVHTQFSYKRKKYKQFEGDRRAPGLEKAIRAISLIEQKGQKPERTAAAIVSAAGRRRPASLQPTGLLGEAGSLLARALPVLVQDMALGLLFSTGEKAPDKQREM